MGLEGRIHGEHWSKHQSPSDSKLQQLIWGEPLSRGWNVFGMVKRPRNVFHQRERRQRAIGCNLIRTAQPSHLINHNFQLALPRQPRLMVLFVSGSPLVMQTMANCLHNNHNEGHASSLIRSKAKGIKGGCEPLTFERVGKFVRASPLMTSHEEPWAHWKRLKNTPAGLLCTFWCQSINASIGTIKCLPRYRIIVHAPIFVQ